MNTNVGRTKGALKLENRSIISQLIYKWRLSKGWTQKEAAESMGIITGTYAHYEVLTPDIRSISFALANKLKDQGLDLSHHPEIEISANRKGRMTRSTSETNHNPKTDEFQGYFDKARKAFTEAKDKMDGKVKVIDEKIKVLYTKIEEFEAEIKDLESKKAIFLKKMHKIDLGTDSIDQCLGTKPDEELPAGTAPNTSTNHFENLLPKDK